MAARVTRNCAARQPLLGSAGLRLLTSGGWLPLVPAPPQVDDLREEKHLLQRALQSVQGDPAAVAHCLAVLAGTLSPKGARRGSRPPRNGALALHADASGPRYTESCDDERDDASSISLMSLNDDDGSVTTAAATPTTAASLAVSRPACCSINS